MEGLESRKRTTEVRQVLGKRRRRCLGKNEEQAEAILEHTKDRLNNRKKEKILEKIKLGKYHCEVCGQSIIHLVKGVKKCE